MRKVRHAKVDEKAEIRLEILACKPKCVLERLAKDVSRRCLAFRKAGRLYSQAASSQAMSRLES